jgi:hypothetical protein
MFRIEKFISLIDEALRMATPMIPTYPNPEQLQGLIDTLIKLKQDAKNGSLCPSEGLRLGLNREVADWIEPLDSPLRSPINAIDVYYQQHL